MEIKQEVVFCRVMSKLRTGLSPAIGDAWITVSSQTSAVANIVIAAYIYWMLLYARCCVKCFIIFRIITLWRNLIILFATFIFYRNDKIIQFTSTKTRIQNSNFGVLMPGPFSESKCCAFPIIFHILINDEDCIVGNLEIILFLLNCHEQCNRMRRGRIVVPTVFHSHSPW